MIGRPPRLVVVDASTMVLVIGGDVAWNERFDGWLEDRAFIVAPPHFRSEVSNALVKSLRLDAVDAIVRLQRLFAAGVDIVDHGFTGLFDTIELAVRHGLTVYDAAYLSAAIELEGELATADKALARAARKEDIGVIS